MMAAWHHLNTDQTGYWVDPEVHMENLLKRPQHLFDRQYGESGQDMFDRKGNEAMAPAGMRTTGDTPVHGAGLYDAIVGRGEAIRKPISMLWNPERMTSPRLLDGYHRSQVALMAQQQGGRQVRLPVEYVTKGWQPQRLPGMTGPTSKVPLEQSYAGTRQSYEDEVEPSRPLGPNRRR
jgi:hypothetical protein